VEGIDLSQASLTNWFSLGLEMLAVGLGVFGGFIADLFLERHLEKGQKIRALNLLKPELEANMRIMDLLWFGIIRNKATYSHFNLDMWRGVSTKIDLITNVELLTDITAAYYNFEQFEKALDLFYTYLAMYISHRDEILKAQVLYVINQHRTVMLDRLAEPGDETNTTMPYRTRKAIEGIESELKRLDC
jgi:hypothetical protein